MANKEIRAACWGSVGLFIDCKCSAADLAACPMWSKVADMPWVASIRGLWASSSHLLSKSGMNWVVTCIKRAASGEGEELNIGGRGETTPFSDATGKL